MRLEPGGTITVIPGSISCGVVGRGPSQFLTRSRGSQGERRDGGKACALFEPAEEGGDTVTCPSLPGLVTEGDTLEEARVMAAYVTTKLDEATVLDRMWVADDLERLRREGQI